MCLRNCSPSEDYVSDSGARPCEISAYAQFPHLTSFRGKSNHLSSGYVCRYLRFRAGCNKVSGETQEGQEGRQEG
ncbi:hypothetical protein PUN28_017629 [Cardiocondyla obscurior]|uniref:Uncharacterized protein n=1 Tax=Cardiocondyla obscurior TaxID=286306 RepID=A0AAW2EN63_9HYME